MSNTQLAEQQILPYDEALIRLADGGFDAVVFSDGTTTGYSSKNLSNTQKVYLDSADFGHVLSPILSFADIYLKCQHPSGRIFSGDSVSLEPYSGHVPVIPWPYCPNQLMKPEWTENVSPMSQRRVFFHGWAWPAKRVEAVQKIVESKIPFHGGLYRRKEAPIVQVISPGLETNCIAPNEYARQMVESQVVLNAVGNGQMCFRLVEAMSMGCCIVSTALEVTFPGRAPKSGIEWMVCDIKDLPDVCNWLLDNPEKCIEMGKSARAYYENFLTPEYAAKRLIQILGWPA